jgi:hypothetical protein
MPQHIGGHHTAGRRPQYIAATFYTLIAIGGIVLAATGEPTALLITVVAGLYAFYLWRGGRFVIFIV